MHSNTYVPMPLRYFYFTLEPVTDYMVMALSEVTRRYHPAGLATPPIQWVPKLDKLPEAFAMLDVNGTSLQEQMLPMLTGSWLELGSPLSKAHLHRHHDMNGTLFFWFQALMPCTKACGEDGFDYGTWKRSGCLDRGEKNVCNK